MAQDSPQEPLGRMVVGVDGSESAAHALGWALHQAARVGALVEVVQSWDLASLVSPVGLTSAENPDFEEATRRSLDHTVERAQAAAGGEEVAIERTVVAGAPAGVLVERSADAWCAVVGRSGTGSLGALVVGSVSMQLAHHGTRPVVVVPRSARLDGAHREVVVGVDGSPGSTVALRWAADLAVREGARLVVAQALGAYPVDPWGTVTFVDEGAAEDAAERFLTEAVAAGLPGPRPAEISCVPIAGDPAHALTELAGPSTLLVVGSRGRGGFKGLLLGSVSRRCVHLAVGPVAVVPTPH